MKSNAEIENAQSAKTPVASSAEKRGAKSLTREKPASQTWVGQERLQKLLSRAGVASRRAAETLIEEGQVSVNGHVVKELGAKADPLVDKITVSGRPLLLSDAAPTVILLHKPRGYMTTKSDPEGRPIIMDLLPKKLQKVNPVGRLDFDTAGVLLLTDDGDLLHLLTHPSHGVEKVYHARVGGQIQSETVRILETGVHIFEGDETSKTKIKTAPCRVRVRAQTEKNALVEVTLREGRNRQVRKMLETMGHAVSSLRRIKFAGFELEELPPGGYRLLLPGEIHALRKSVTRVLAKKQSREAILKEAAAAIEAKERRNPRPKTAAKYVSRGKSQNTSAQNNSEESAERTSPRERSTLARSIAPSRSSYGTKNRDAKDSDSRAPRRVASYEASGQETPRPYSPDRNGPRAGAKPRRAADHEASGQETQRPYSPDRAAPRSSAPRSAAPRSSASRSSAPRSTAPNSSAPRSSTSRSASQSAPRSAPKTAPYKNASEDKHHDYSSSRDSTSPNARPRNASSKPAARAPQTARTRDPKNAPPLGERIRRQWKND